MSNLIQFPKTNPMHELLSNMFEGHEVRTAIKKDQTIWFVLKDICEAIGISDYHQAGGRLRENQRGMCVVPTPSGNQEMTVISESGLYSVVLKSRSPKAQPFQEWVEDVVLPAIRKHGQFNAAENDNATGIDVRDPRQLVNIAMQLIDVNQELTDEVLKTRTQLAEAQPKVEALERLTVADGSFNITTSAKLLQVQPKKLFKHLSENKWIYRRAGQKNWLGYQDKIQSGLLEHKITTVVDATTGDDRVYEQVKVTAKGLARLAEEFGQEAI